jgi:hypothetical protein
LRDRKPILVDKIRRGDAEVEVFYDFREHDFFFEAPGTRSREHASTFREVYRRLNEVYEKAAPLDWRPVILVSLHEKYDDRDHSIRSKPEEGASVHLTFRRCEISPRPDHAECVERITAERERDERHGRDRGRGPIEREGYIEREHEIDFEAGNPSDYDREARAKTLERPDTYANAGYVVELPYTDETWRGLVALKLAIDSLHSKVEALISMADFRDRLAQFASSATPVRMLTTGEP